MKKTLYSTLIFSLLLFPVIVLAGPDPLPTADQTLKDGDEVVNLIQTLGNWMFTILLVLAVIMLLVAAFKYLTSAGSEERVKSAHKIILYAVIALVVAFLAQGIIAVVRSVVAPDAPAGGAPNNQVIMNPVSP